MQEETEINNAAQTGEETETANQTAADGETETTETDAAATSETDTAEATPETAETDSAPEAATETETAAAPEPEPEDISYHAVQKDGSVTAIWEMQGQKHIRTIDPRSREGLEILRLFSADEGEEAAA